MTPLTPDQQARAADPNAVKYALGVAWRYIRKVKDQHLRDEFESAALLGLVRAARTYDPSFGTDFLRTHLKRCVIGELIQCHRSWMPKGYRRPESRPDGTVIPFTDGIPDTADDAAETAWDQFAAGEDPVGWEMEYADEVEGMARSLPANYARVLRLYHLRPGMTITRAAEILGLSVTEAHRLLTQAHRWLAERSAA